MAHRLEALVDGREIHGGANGLGEETDCRFAEIIIVIRM